MLLLCQHFALCFCLPIILIILLAKSTYPFHTVSWTILQTYKEVWDTTGGYRTCHTGTCKVCYLTFITDLQCHRWSNIYSLVWGLLGLVPIIWPHQVVIWFQVHHMHQIITIATFQHYWHCMRTCAIMPFAILHMHIFN